MTKKVLAATLLMATLAGCGTTGGVILPQSTAGLAASAMAKKKQASAPTAPTKAPAGMDQVSYSAGLTAGLTQAASGKPSMRQGMVPDPVSYQYGMAMGLLQGSINSYNRISGDFNAQQWMSFANVNEAAMKDALSALQANPTLAAKAGVAIGILEGGISSYDSISGSFDQDQWSSFAQSNRNVLQNALNALAAVSLI